MQYVIEIGNSCKGEKENLYDNMSKKFPKKSEEFCKSVYICPVTSEAICKWGA